MIGRQPVKQASPLEGAALQSQVAIVSEVHLWDAPFVAGSLKVGLRAKPEQTRNDVSRYGLHGVVVREGCT